MTAERRLARAAANQAVKELAFDLKAQYAEHLPKVLKRVIEATARKDNTIARDRFRKDVMVEMADRLYGRPAQSIVGKGGGPLMVTFSQVLAGVNGAVQEKIV